MALDKTGLAEGIVSLQRYGITYTGQWVTTGNRIFVYWNLLEDSSLLGMFHKQPENLARMLLLDLVKREPTKHEIDAPKDVAVHREEIVDKIRREGTTKEKAAPRAGGL